MRANVAHDMVVAVHQPILTSLFDMQYRYRGAGVGYQVANILTGGFTPMIAAALVIWGDGSWHTWHYYCLRLFITSLVVAIMLNTTQEKSV